MLVSSRVT